MYLGHRRRRETIVVIRDGGASARCSRSCAGRFAVLRPGDEVGGAQAAVAASEVAEVVDVAGPQGRVVALCDDNEGSAVGDRAGRLLHGRAVSEVADDLGCDWHTVMNALVLFGEPLIDAMCAGGVCRTKRAVTAAAWTTRPTVPVAGW